MFARTLRAVIAGQQHVECRQHEQREQGADQHPHHHDDADGEAAGGAGAVGEQQRHNAGDHGGGGHQHRPHPHHGGLADRGGAVEAFIVLDLVGERHHQDAVLGDQADQGDEADLGVDVQRGEAEIQRQQRAAHRKRHRDHDHQRIAEALVLRRQHQEDHHQRHAEADGEAVAFLDELAAVRQPVDADAGRQRLRLHEGDRLSHGDAGLEHRGERRRIHLVELRQTVGLR